MQNVVWTEDKVRDLKKLHGENKTWREMMAHFECSKGTIAGAVWRYVKGVKRSQSARAILKARNAQTLLEEAAKGTVKFPDQRFLSGQCCRAMIGEVSDMTCCANKPLEGSVYCHEHHVRYREVPKRNDCERLARIFK